MKKKEIKLIGEIDFRDIKVKIYNDPYESKEHIQCCWQIRNPETEYTGIAFINWETQKISYPEDAVIPKQTKEDREILPKFMITGCDEIDDKFISCAKSYMKDNHKKRNKNI